MALVPKSDKTVILDFAEPGGQGMQKEPTNEFFRIKRHWLHPASMGIAATINLPRITVENHVAAVVATANAAAADGDIDADEVRNSSASADIYANSVALAALSIEGAAAGDGQGADVFILFAALLQTGAACATRRRARDPPSKRIFAFFQLR